MILMDLLTKWMGKENGNSKEKAKERLRLVLVHDRASVNPELLNNLKEDLIHVISKYMEIDKGGLDVNLDHSGDSAVLVANIPIRQVWRGGKGEG